MHNVLSCQLFRNSPGSHGREASVVIEQGLIAKPGERCLEFRHLAGGDLAMVVSSPKNTMNLLIVFS